MASGEGAPRALTPAASNDDGFPQFPRSERGPPSIISSRMTDIMTEDGGESDTQRGGSSSQRKSALYSEGTSRPGTARTAMSQRAPWGQGTSLRRGLSGKRGSVGGGSVGGASLAARPVSSMSRSHVPTLTSHAFFRPMSSQKLQAQRGIARPSTMSRQVAPHDVAVKTNRDSLVSTQGAAVGGVLPSGDEGETRPPPSRGTEFTEQEAFDRITANTSPTHGYHPTSSVTDSVRPLQRKPEAARNLTLDINKTYKAAANAPTPVRTPHSMRSSFLMQRMESSNGNREMEGGEKLDSLASSPQLPPSTTDRDLPTKEEMKKPALGRNYEYFLGNTVFCLGGRLQNTRHRPVNIATGAFIVVPAALFLAFSAPWIWNNLSPAIPITFAYVFFICMSSFIHASVSDPGILPRNMHRFPPDENDDPLRLGPPTTEWALVKSSDPSTAAMEVPTKYCKTCNLWRPPRAHHCRLCDNCVETQDHHCVWLNNCVGRRNYRYFFTFISSATILGLYLSGASLAQILVYANRQDISPSDAISHFRVPFAMVIYGFLACLYPAALMGYHLFLIARGETTREYINSHKFLKKDRYRAFTQASWFKNWFVVLCRARPPTYYRFKHKYAEGDQRLATHRRGQRPRRQPVVDSKEGLEMQDVKPQPADQQAHSGGFLSPTSLRKAANSVLGRDT
ncbi:DHHC palmitoyltransferase-domain-containing protein [Staphylotrichum tortipilum]|uniref:Palmitoyltransferase n=1 Tax=Staphylotrichum tortipilum TaxID=2831512 RepID=A0AAN6MQ54_9PEZI|nr:DHHC palmitoyltransferase-domain-containing protein [Staphylotrichum longicolle]